MEPAPQGSRIADAVIVARCRSNDPDAWNELVERFSRYVFAITTRAYRLSAHDSEDVFQEVFARAYTHLHTLRSDEAIRPWIGQLARRLAIDRLRASGREIPDVQVPEEPIIDIELERIDEALDLRRAMDLLPGHCNAILDRFFCRDQSYQTIAAELEIPAGTIASRIARCLAKLRSQLQGR